ncbi:MAG: hypothetical protein Kow00117_10220 [Phototrophicales bacterium]
MQNQYHITEVGQGKVDQQQDMFRLTIPPVTGDIYHNAQITSYITRRDFEFEPPVSLHIRAYATGDIHGTAGFGFWNHPYGRVPRLPKAIWFFYGSQPNNMPLAKNIPGYGWKCATFDAANWRFLALLPSAPIGFLLMRLPSIYNQLWGIGQRALGVDECLLDETLLNIPHDYSIIWEKDHVTFMLDNKIIFKTKRVPRGKLGFIAWIDNQYAIVTPQGQFGHGLLPLNASQELRLESILFE